MPFWGEGGVLLGVAQDTAQTSWPLLEQAELSCCQCPCSFPLSWLQVLPRVICSPQPLQPCMESRMLRWCNPSLVQNKFPPDQAEFSPGFERLCLKKPWKLNTYSESSFPSGVWIPPAPQHGLSPSPSAGMCRVSLWQTPIPSCRQHHERESEQNVIGKTNHIVNFCKSWSITERKNRGSPQT